MHALHLRLDGEQHESAKAYAEKHGLTLTAAVRLFLERGLAEQPRSNDGVSGIAGRLDSLERAVIAALIASESARLAMESVFAHDRERFIDLPDRAAAAARARLAELDAAVAGL